jgi:hypothetical protein
VLSKEGLFTRIGAIAAVVAPTPAYLAVAGDRHDQVTVRIALNPATAAQRWSNGTC